MARRSRVEINRAGLDAVMGGLADGVSAIASRILLRAVLKAPDAPAMGEGLVRRNAAITFVGKKRVFQRRGDGDGATVKKPRGSDRLQEGRVLAIVGFGFPGMFQEFGTVHHGAQPFLTPAASEVVGSEAQVLLSTAMQRRLRGERDPKSAEIGARISAARAARAARQAGDA
jgi:hypothetical protein